MAAPRALIAITADEMRDAVVRAASPVVTAARMVAAADEAADALDTTSADLDLAIVDIAALRAHLRRIRRGRAEQPLIATPLVLVLDLAELQDALAVLHLCHGLVFWENDPQKLESMFVLALEGYSAAPAALLPDLVTDRVRLGLIERLTPIERQALELLGNALSNRAIAARLDVSEPLAKSLVRTVLTKLRLKNRTEAAVLVARWRSPVGTELARDLAVTTETTPL